MGARRSARIVAVQGVYAWEDSNISTEDILRMEWLDKDIGEESRAFASLIITGTLENQEEIDQTIKDHLTNWSFDRLTKIDRAILRVSTYALLFQKDIPSSVTIDEGIEIAKKYGLSESSGFVNGVLDGINKALLS